MKKVRATFWIFLVSAAFFPATTNAYEILFHEFSNDQANIYAVSASDLKVTSIGNGILPQKSPNNKFLSYIHLFKMEDRTYSPGNPGMVVVKDLQKNMPIIIKGRPQVNFIACHCWHPESKSVAFVALAGPSMQDGYVGIYDLSSEPPRKIFRFQYVKFEGALLGTSLQWSPDGKELLFSCRAETDEGGSVRLINAADGSSRILSEKGCLPRFIDNRRILFVSGKEILTIDRDGGEGKKIVEMNLSVISSSQVAGNKIVLQVEEREKEKQLPCDLYILDLSNNKIEAVVTGVCEFSCPVISPDGTQMTVIGIEPGPEEMDIGYYLYDFATHRYSLIKKLENTTLENFVWFLLLGYGNGASWH